MYSRVRTNPGAPLLPLNTGRDMSRPGWAAIPRDYESSGAALEGDPSCLQPVRHTGLRSMRSGVGLFLSVEAGLGLSFRAVPVETRLIKASASVKPLSGWMCEHAASNAGEVDIPLILR